MSLVQFGAASVQANHDLRHRATLAAVFATGLTVSDKVASFKGYPLTLYTLDNGSFALGVVIDDDAAIADSPATTTSRGTTFILGSDDTRHNYLAIVERNSESTDVAGSAMFRGMPLGTNEDGTVILFDTELTNTDPDAEEIIFWGTNTLTVRRYGDKWYLVVCMES